MALTNKEKAQILLKILRRELGKDIEEYSSICADIAKEAAYADCWEEQRKLDEQRNGPSFGISPSNPHRNSTYKTERHVVVQKNLEIMREVYDYVVDVFVEKGVDPNEHPKGD